MEDIARASNPDTLDAIVIGGGPAGLTAGIYLARFARRFCVVDAGESRAAAIPISHNIPFFGPGIPGEAILQRIRAHAAQYGVTPIAATVTALTRTAGAFHAVLHTSDGSPRRISARCVLLATGSRDVEPCLPDLASAVREGLVRYCPICDGYEARNKRIGVLGCGSHGLTEAVFIARTYSDNVSLLSLGEALKLAPEQLAIAQRYGIRRVEAPIKEILAREGRIIARQEGGGTDLRFDVLYSALGLQYRAELGLSLGAQSDERGALTVNESSRTSVPGLYAAGDVVRGLDQIVVGMGQAAIAAADIHNHCDLPVEGAS